jgi:hypothetical protein
MLLSTVAGPVYRHRAQAHGEETAGGSHAQDHLGNA